jgi:hypothetical protein
VHHFFSISPGVPATVLHQKGRGTHSAGLGPPVHFGTDSPSSELIYPMTPKRINLFNENGLAAPRIFAPGNRPLPIGFPENKG